MPNNIAQMVADYRAWWERYSDVPYGYCWCGCGQQTRPAKWTELKVRGEPVRWVTGHHTRKYPLAYKVEDRGYKSPCWIWQLGSLNGYGKVTRNGKQMGAHRAYYEEYIGPIPAGMQIDHLCRVPSCVNPEHLEAVTQAENGRRGANTKLTADQVREIRRLHREQRFTHPQLARLFDVGPTHISSIVNYRYWKDV